MQNTFKKLIDEGVDLLLSYVLPVIVALATVYFAAGVLQYIYSGSNAEKRSKAIKYMVTGIIALFVMATTWAIVGIFSEFIGSELGIPQFESSTASGTSGRSQQESINLGE